MPSGRAGQTPPPPEARGRLQLRAPPVGHSPGSGPVGAGLPEGRQRFDGGRCRPGEPRAAEEAVFPWAATEGRRQRAATEGPPARDTPERRSLQARPPPAPAGCPEAEMQPVIQRWGPDGVPELQTGPGGLDSHFSPALPEGCQKSPFLCEIV